MTSQTDLERIGIFKEMSYHTIRDPYDKPSNYARSAFRGKQMYCSGSKEKSAMVDGYFSPFIRIFNGDNKINLERLIRIQRKESSMKNKGKAWIPPNESHHLLGLGSSLDTFSGPTPYFKPTMRIKHTKLDHRRNFYTSPAKKGCGSYVDITIGKYPRHKSDPYDKRLTQSSRHRSSTGKNFYLNLHPKDFFDPNPYRQVAIKRRSSSRLSNKVSHSKAVFKPSSAPKSIGGCKDGCFSPFPRYTSEKLKKNYQIKTTKPHIKIPSCPKSYPITSILEMNIKRRINSSNYKSIKPSFFDS